MGDTVVAVKKIVSQWMKLNAENSAEFEKEVQALKRLRHKNVVQFYGAGEFRFEIHSNILLTDLILK